MCNKGFSGYLSILPRSKFDVAGQESSPQSLTAHSLNRYRLDFTTKNKDSKNKTTFSL